MFAQNRRLIILAYLIRKEVIAHKNNSMKIENENKAAESSREKQNKHASQTDGVEAPISRDQTKNTSVVKTALLLGCISLIIFSVPFCSSSPG